ncbi:hypothetical protein C8R44DRAFT_309270 [Mycena epipterygia]|nr:hypothetical protein C8R44DRAFT_309270 [Mycena epipterygia]
MSSPSLVGGIALRAYDLPGASVFAAAYGLLLPIFVYRLVDRRSRTAVIIQAIFFAVERGVVFSLRAAVAAHPNTESLGISEYMQATFALGFLSLAHIVAKLTRSVLVNSTTDASSADSKSAAGMSLAPPLVSEDSWKLGPPPLPDTPTADDPRRRFWFRRWSECMGVLYLAAMVTAIVATANIYAANDIVPNHRDQALRYASSAIGLTLVLSITTTLLWAQRNVPRIDLRAVRFLLAATTLLMIPPIYRLVVMRSTTPDIAAVEHQALNTKTDKAAFYVFHVLPEWTLVAALCGLNVKEICQTGFKGDHRWRDETPKERAKRERKARERAAKKAGAKNASFELKSTSGNTESVVTLA